MIKKSIQFLMSALILMASGAFVTTPALSADGKKKEQTPEEQYIKPMPDMEFLPVEEFKEKTTLHKIAPYGEESVAFTVRLPNEWKETEHSGSGDSQSFNRKIFGELTTFYGPVGQASGFPSRFFVQAEALPYEMTAEQWLMQFLMSHGYPLQGFEVHSNTRAEALYVVLEGDVSYIVRLLVMRSGKRMITAHHYMPIEFWESGKAMQAQSMASLNLGQEEAKLVEKMKTYHFLDVAKIEYPTSWKLRATPVRNIDRMNVSLLNVPKHQFERGQYVLDGKIEVSLVSVFEGEGLEQEIENIKQKLTESNLKVADALPLEFEADTSALFDFVDTQIYRASNEQDKVLDYEFWLSVMAHEDYYYFMTMVTPSRTQDIGAWTRNSETYKLMLNRVEPQGANFEM